MSVIPVGAPVYRSPRYLLLCVILFILAVVGALSWSPAKEAIERQACNNKILRFVLSSVASDLYAKECGCPQNLDFRFSCNSQYLPLTIR